MAAIGRALRWSWMTVARVVRSILHVLATVLRPISIAVRTALVVVRRALAVVRRALGDVRAFLGWLASLLARAVAPFRHALAVAVSAVVAVLAPIVAATVRTIAIALSSARTSFAATWRAMRTAVGPAIQPVRDALDELRRVVATVRGRRRDETPLPQAHPLAADSGPASVGFAQAHRAVAVASDHPRPTRRASPIFVIAVTVAVTMLLVAIVDETLQPGQPAAAAVSLLLGAVLAGLITAPQRVSEGLVGFVLGCAMTVGIGLLIPNTGGSAEASPVPAFLSLVIVGGIAYAPGWAIGGRRHRRAAAASGD